MIQEQWSHSISDHSAHLIGGLCAFIVILPLSTVNNIAMFWRTNLISFGFALFAVVFMIYRAVNLIVHTGGV